ncbi:ferrous iron transporter B [Listeria monocytogenes]|nr:ferrous iron transporter B [Listeria monocytogenes]
MIPSATKSVINPDAPMAVKKDVTESVSGPPIKPSSKSDSGAPTQVKVIWKINHIIPRKIGMPKNLWVKILSSLSDSGISEWRVYSTEVKQIS